MLSSTASTVYFLPVEKAGNYGRWIAAINGFDSIKEFDYTAVKIHFGEEGNTGFITPSLVRPVVEQIKARNARPFLTDANTIYVGKRADAVHHAQLAHEHGFTIEACGCPVIIADGLRGNAGVNVQVGLKHFKEVSIANAVHYADSLVFLSHFKGHEISGFGGALKNMGMGCGTRAGKYAMHDRVRPEIDEKKCIACGACIKWCGGRALNLDGEKIAVNDERCTGCGECILSCPEEVFRIPWDEITGAVQEKIVEYAWGVGKGKPLFCVNFLQHMTKYCDCYADRGGPLVSDIGILASSDPVALDQASADIVNKRRGGDFWREIFPNIDWTVQLRYAEKLGLGTRKYSLVEYNEK